MNFLENRNELTNHRSPLLSVVSCALLCSGVRSMATSDLVRRRPAAAAASEEATPLLGGSLPPPARSAYVGPPSSTSSGSPPLDAPPMPTTATSRRVARPRATPRRSGR